MNNSSNLDTSTSASSSSDYFKEIFVYIVIAKRVIAGIGLFLNLVVMTVILRNYKKLNNPMYLFIFNVAIPDVIELIAFTTDLFHIRDINRYPTILFKMFYIQMTWYLTIFSVLGLSFNRTVAVLFWQYYESVSELN